MYYFLNEFVYILKDNFLWDAMEALFSFFHHLPEHIYNLYRHINKY